MMNSKITREFVEKNVVVLKDNFVYRIADSIRLNINHKINKEILDNTIYQGSILNTCLLKRKNNNNNNNNNVDNKKMLVEAIKEYKKEQNIEIYNDSELVVYLRSGDTIDRVINFKDNIIKQIDDKLKIYKNIKTIVIVTALHYGQPIETNTFYKKGCFSYTNESYKKNIDFIHSLILAMPLPCIIQSNENVDIDIVKLCYSKNIIFTNYGGFSKLIKELNEKYFINT